MAKFKISKKGREKLILTGSEIALVEALFNITRLGDTPLKVAAFDILQAMEKHEYISSHPEIKLGVTVSTKTDPKEPLSPEFEQKFSEFNTGTYLTIELENQ